MPAKISLADETKKIETLLGNATALRKAYSAPLPPVETLYARAVALTQKQRAARTANARAYEAGATPRLAYLRELETLEASYSALITEYSATRAASPAAPSGAAAAELASRAATLRTLALGLAAQKRTAETLALSRTAEDLAARVASATAEQRAQLEAQFSAVEGVYRQLVSQGGQLTSEQRAQLDQSARSARAGGSSSGVGWLLGLGAAAGIVWAISR